MRKVWLSLLVAGLVGSLALPSHGEKKVRLILKSARQASTYYAFAVGQANAIMAGAPDVEMTVEESPGSMANVKESKVRENFIFTSPTTLISDALKARGTSAREDTKNQDALAASRHSNALGRPRGQRRKTLRDLVGKRFIPGGAGSAGVKVTERVFDAIGIKDKVTLVLVDLNEGVQAVKNNRAVGFATSSSVPAGMISEIAATTPIRLLELEDADYEKVSEAFARRTIPAGTKATTTLRRGNSRRLHDCRPSEEVAYKITKAFWRIDVWEKAHPAMKLIQMET